MISLDQNPNKKAPITLCSTYVAMVSQIFWLILHQRPTKVIKIETCQKGCGVTAFNKSNILGCDTFIYDLHYFEETLATLHDLVCDEEYKTQLLNR